MLKNPFDHPPDPRPFDRLRTGLARKGEEIMFGPEMSGQTPGNPDTRDCTFRFVGLIKRSWCGIRGNDVRSSISKLGMLVDIPMLVRFPGKNT